MKELFFISSWQYKICRQILREQELRDKKKGKSHDFHNSSNLKSKSL